MSYFKNNEYSDFEINLLLSYVILSIIMSVSPYDRLTWLVENATVWCCACIVFYIRLKKHRFSNTSLLILYIAAVLHTIGGYFSFQLVPGGKLLFFCGPGGRNNFDRLGHFFCGLLTFPLFEVMTCRKITATVKSSFVLSAMSIMGVAALYELFEWLDFLIAEARFGEIILGSQGDRWDAQADMFMCLLGCIFSGVLAWFWQKRRDCAGVKFEQ